MLQQLQNELEHVDAQRVSYDRAVLYVVGSACACLSDPAALVEYVLQQLQHADVTIVDSRGVCRCIVHST
jgi:hypothetical protein